MNMEFNKLNLIDDPWLHAIHQNFLSEEYANKLVEEFPKNEDKIS